MKIYVKDASGAERRISIPNAIIRTGYNYKTENDTVDIYKNNFELKESIELVDGISITITKN